MTEPLAPSPFYPVSLEVSGRPCLVVGGGTVAARKARTLLECGAVVAVIAPALSEEMEALASLLRTVERREYAVGDASDFRLVVTATGVPEVDGTVYADAEAAGVWVNSADDPEHSSFILPAVHRDGAVTVAVSTGGLSPALGLMAANAVGGRVRRRSGGSRRASRRGTGAAEGGRETQ